MIDRIHRMLTPLLRAAPRNRRRDVLVGGYGKYPGDEEWCWDWPLDERLLEMAQRLHPAMTGLVARPGTIDHEVVLHRGRMTVYASIRGTRDGTGARRAALVLLVGLVGGAPSEAVAWTVFDRLARLQDTLGSRWSTLPTTEVPLAMGRAGERLQRDLSGAGPPATSLVVPLPDRLDGSPVTVPTDGHATITVMESLRRQALDGAGRGRPVWLVARAGGDRVRLLARDPEPEDRGFLVLPEPDDADGPAADPTPDRGFARESVS